MCYSVLVEQDLKKLSLLFDAHPFAPAFETYAKLHAKDPRRYRAMADNERIFPLYFAPIILYHENIKSIIPMRYRLRPADSPQELPSKYNLYNARSDRVTTSPIWRKLFMRKHGIIVFREFYEWVKDAGGQRKILAFERADRAPLIAPVIYDYWTAGDQDEEFGSFAIITTDPPDEVRQAGHDRCPVILEQGQVDQWMKPVQQNQQDMLKIITATPNVRFTPHPISNYR